MLHGGQVMVVRKLVLLAATIALFGVGNGAAVATVGGDAPPVPAAPSISVWGDQATVTWQPVPGATSYEAQISLNGGPWGYSEDVGASIRSVTFDSLRSPSLGCETGPCTVQVRVESLNGAWESGWSTPSALANLPVPSVIAMQTYHVKGKRSTTVYLFGRATAGVTFRLQKFDVTERVWNDAGPTTTARVQTLPSSKKKKVRALAWVFKIVVRSKGLSNFRVVVDPAGDDGGGASRPFGVRR